MQYSFLEQMICPFCGSDFNTDFIIKQNQTELIDGIVSCSCNEFPVLNGILILNLNSLNDLVVELVRDKKIDKAIPICLGFDYFKRIKLEQTTGLILPFPHQLFDILKYFLSRSAEITAKKKFDRLYNKYSDKKISFSNLLGNSIFDKYLRYRFSAGSFLALYPFLTIMHEKKTRILDLGCGAGHGSFVISEYIKPFQMCCADKCFNLLYLAKKYFAPEANFVCLDFDNALPFKNGTFSSIVMSDALFLVKSRFSFVHEMERVLTWNGISLFLHVHSSLGNDLAPIGNRKEVMTPREWQNLFETIKLKTVFIPEEKILKDFLFQNTLKLKSESTETELNSSNALIIVATSDKSVFRDYDSIDRIFLSKKNNLIVNPIYQITQKEKKIVLSRPSLDVDSVGDFYPTIDKYLPKKMEIDKNLVVNKSLPNSNLEQVKTLIRNFVILNVPENYV